MKIKRRCALLLPLLVLLAGCDEKGNPTTDTEVWAIVIVILGALIAACFCWWCVTRFEK